MESDTEPAVVYFDGVCGLCNSLVDFVIRRDPKRRFRFAALQSPRGQAMLRRVDADPGAPLDTMIVEDAGRLFLRSDAAIRVFRRMGFPWSLLAAGAILPHFVRDALYGFIANRRYKWFGRRDSCRVPTPAERERFIES